MQCQAVAALQIRDMENHMAHESIPISQERQMVKHIKKLRDSRQRVRQYAHMYAGIENARAAVRSGQGELKELLQERQVLIPYLSLALAADYRSMIARSTQPGFAITM